MASPRTQVVIVGGGSGAVAAARISAARAQFDPATHDLTLITQLPYNVYLIASARMITTSSQNLDNTDAALFPYNKLFKSGNAGKVVQGKVVNVTETQVELKDGTSVPYDYLVLATGSTWKGPVNFDLETDEEVKAHIEKWRGMISKSKSVVIVGGGAVGIELSAEIAHFYPTTKVTLLTASPTLLNPTYPEKFINYLNARLAKVPNLTVLTSEKISLSDLPSEGIFNDGNPTTLTTEKGTALEADLFIPTTGPKPNTSILKSFHNGNILNEQGYVKVTTTLNVKAGDKVLENVWAMGDIIEWKEQHTSAKALVHADIVAKNVVVATSGKGALVEYKDQMEGIFLTIGPSGGIAYLPLLWGITLGDWIVKTIKSGSLFVSFLRKNFNL